MAAPSALTQRLRLAELMAALSLATDLGMGQPLEQALRTCLIAIELAGRLGLTKSEISEVFYVALLRFLGCTSDAHETAQIFGGDDLTARRGSAPLLGGSPSELARVLLRVGSGQGPLRRAEILARLIARGPGLVEEVARAHCEMAEHLAVRLELPVGVRRALRDEYVRWDGLAAPRGLSRTDVPISSRIVLVARDAEVLYREGGSQLLRASLRARSGHAYDPAVAGPLLHHLDEVVAAIEVASPWEAVLDREPEPHPWVPESRLESVLETFADFVDMKSPFMAGHSRGVGTLAEDASTDNKKNLRRAGLVHDLGRVAVPNGIWDKSGPLTDGEWEQVRLHPYYSERILERSAALKPLSICAGMHHERLDGSGYHRRAVRPEISRDARILAAADAYQAMTQPRAFRQALSPAHAAEALEAEASAGRLDADAVHSVLSAAGHRRQRIVAWPAGLSDREVEVLRLLCRGGTKAEVARLLQISARTVDHHVRHIYDKVGVATRAGATLFAVENDLLQ